MNDDGNVQIRLIGTVDINLYKFLGHLYFKCILAIVNVDISQEKWTRHLSEDNNIEVDQLYDGELVKTRELCITKIKELFDQPVLGLRNDSSDS
jgi:hypothetical protein